MLQLIRQMLEVGRRLITSSCLRKPSLIEFYWIWLTALFGFRRDMTQFSLWDADTDTLVHHWIVSLSKKVCTQCTHVFPVLYQCQNNPHTRLFTNVFPMHAIFVLMSKPEKICHVPPKTYTDVVTFIFKLLNLHSQDDAADTRAKLCIEMNFKISNSIRDFFVGPAYAHMTHFATL